MKAGDEAKFLVVTAAKWREMSNATRNGDTVMLSSRVVPRVETKVFPFEPAALAVDGCGTVFAVTRRGGLVVYDPETGRAVRIPCIDVRGCTSVAVSAHDIYFTKQVHGETDRILCLARVNYQVRWEMPCTGNDRTIISIAACEDGTLFTLNKKGEIFRRRRKWGTERVEFDRSRLDLAEPGIAVSWCRDKLFVLCLKDGVYSILSHRETGAEGEPGHFREQLSVVLPEAVVTGSFAATPSGAFLVSVGRQSYRITAVRGYLKAGTLTTDLLDSYQLGCPWHRVVLDCELPLPANTRIQLSYWANDKQDAYPEWTALPANAYDALILEAKGRYIRFMLELFSDDLGVSSPSARSLRVEFPHRSYLRYLPALYQEDPVANDFLRRFLSIFETLYQESEERIFSTPRCLDPDSVEDRFLPWLAQWLALPFDENLPPYRLRRLIREAPALRRLRGTRRGLEKLLEIYVGDRDRFWVRLLRRIQRSSIPREKKEDLRQFAVQLPLVVETFQMRRYRGEDPKNPEALLFGNDLNSFFVIFKPYGLAPDLVPLVQRMIEQEQPAHTTGHVQILEPWFRLDGHCYLGLNTIFAEHRFTVGMSRLLLDTELPEPEPAGQLGVRSRLASDTILF